MKKVELVDISKSYNKTDNVISNINVTIEPGEFFILVGPSGCGKSTMLRMIAGLEEITGGTLKIGETVANHLPPNKRELSMVFQNYALYPHLTVEQNIAFGLDVKKIKKDVQIKRVADAAEMLGLTDYLKRKPRELSGGQRQRVALARAIVSEAPICLMDEPLSNLDAKLRAQMRSELRRIQRELNMTMIYVTHDQVEAMTMGDRIMILHKGEIQQVGKPIDIYNYPANPFVATFVGSPAMNLANAKVNPKTNELIIEEKFSLALTSEDCLAFENRLLTIGIRPEHLQIAKEETAPKNKVDVKVTNVEVLGNETVFSFQIGQKEWSVKWSGQWQIKIGDIIPLEIDFDALCVFDGETERLIKKPSNVGSYTLQDEVRL